MELKAVPTIRPPATQERWDRAFLAEAVTEYARRIAAGLDRELAAVDLGVPKSTLDKWLRYRQTIDFDPEIVSFFESPSGSEFLRRLVIALHVVMTQVGTCGVRLVCMVLEESGLNRFVAATQSSQNVFNRQIEERIIEFGKKQDQQLAAGMKRKSISVCQDETFFDGICLVAIEPVSNFILVEKMTHTRTAHDWNTAMDEAIGKFNVEVIQSTADEGRALINHAEEHLGVHHSPDLFHIQHEIVKFTSAPLAAAVRKCECDLEKDRNLLEFIEHEARSTPRKQGRPLDFASRISLARDNIAVSAENLSAAQARREQMSECVKLLSSLYHPVNLETGLLRTRTALEDELQACFGRAREIATQAKLSERSVNAVEKSARLIPRMLETITFVHKTVLSQLAQLDLNGKAEFQVRTHLFPSCYLRRIAISAKKEQQKAIEGLAEKLEQALLQQDNAFSQLNDKVRNQCQMLCNQLAYVFQRSSSCVEGRNGSLSLRHHSFKDISERKLASLTVIANYALQREDGTTAAERFFDQTPGDLMTSLFSTMGQLPRPYKVARDYSSNRNCTH